MEQSILTPLQSHLLQFLSKQKEITDHFYLTGGTALSEFYFRHRLSEDIDLFNEKVEVEPLLIEAFLKKNKKTIGYKQIKRSQFLGLVSFLLIFPNNASLKIDFNYYPFPSIRAGKKINRLKIDSWYDITVNKLHTLFMKPRGRDYIDLYIAFKENRLSLQRVILDAKCKFDWHIDPLTLASQFLRANEFHDLPKMLIPFSLEKMHAFYEKLAINLKKDVLR